MIGWTIKHDSLTRRNILIGGQCDLQRSLQIRKYFWDVKGGGRQNAVDANLLRSFVPGRETSKHCQVQLRTYKYFAFQIILLIEQTQQLRGWRWACCPRSPPPPPPPPPWQDPSPPWTSRLLWRQFPRWPRSSYHKWFYGTITSWWGVSCFQLIAQLLMDGIRKTFRAITCYLWSMMDLLSSSSAFFSFSSASSSSSSSPSAIGSLVLAWDPRDGAWEIIAL